MGIQPAAKLSADGTWFTLRRVNSTTGQEYYYVYNDAVRYKRGEGSETTIIDFSSTGIPYELNTWTGEQIPIVIYTQSDESTSIPITLAGNQSTIITFVSKPPEGYPSANKHIANVSGNTLGVSVLKNGSLSVKVGPKTSTPPSYTFEDGTTKTLSPSRGAPIKLINWNLTVEHWDPPNNMSDIEGDAVKHNTTHFLPHLLSWQQIPGLQNVSGRGYYSSSFHWPPCRGSAKPDGAVIDFGTIVHTLRVSVNGHVLPPLDVTAAKADISQWLVRGQNKVEAIVATPLGNVLRPIWAQLQTSGTWATDPTAGGAPPLVADYGLLQDVVITPYTNVVI